MNFIQNRNDALMPTDSVRRDLFAKVQGVIESHFEKVEGLPVAPNVTQKEIQSFLSEFRFESELDADQVLGQVSQKMEDWSLHVGHPSYFGLFNPAAGFHGMLADFLVAAFNSQLGAWHHNPFGVEVEAHLIRYFANRFGLGPSAFGHFTTGGSEANFTSVVVALSRKFPEYAKHGLRGLNGKPVFYCSREFHHSFEKIAHQCGLGRDAVRLVPVTSANVMDVSEARKMIEADRVSGDLPFMMVATAGTTNAGLVEPMEEIAEVAKEFGLHLHVDAAWGGSAILSDRHRQELAGIDQADTITIDPHKLLSVPMGAGMILVREHQWLYQSFGLQTDYVPESETEGLDHYRQSFQFSRRFIGLKLFLQLAIVGQKEYGRIIDQQFAMARLLAKKLKTANFEIQNGASLGVVCFSPPRDWCLTEHQQLVEIADQICRSGEAWISVTRLGGKSVFRACITNHLTRERDLDALVDSLLRFDPFDVTIEDSAEACSQC